MIASCDDNDLFTIKISADDLASINLDLMWYAIETESPMSEPTGDFVRAINMVWFAKEGVYLLNDDDDSEGVDDAS